MLPLKDNIPTSRFPVVTVAIIVICIGVFFWQLAYPTDPQLSQLGVKSIDQSSLDYGAMPYRITHPSEGGDCGIDRQGSGGIVCPGQAEFTQAQSQGAVEQLNQAPWWVTVFTSMFMHGGILHIAGNMLFLWVFGNNIEDLMGRGKFVLFYLLSGLIALYSQALIDPQSTAPTIGASGAVAGVLGAYAVLYPRARVLTLIFIIFFVTLVEIPALFLLAAWFVLQFIPALGEVAVDVGGDQGVAYFAHVGGFIFGLAVAGARLYFWRRREPSRRLPVY